MKTSQKEFCSQSWNFTYMAPEFYQLCAFFADINELRIILESQECF